MQTTRLLFRCFSFSLVLLTNSAVAKWSESFHHDANLNDVFFVDAQTGWCVGDRGTIYHTRDAGSSWERQTSSVDCSLESVHFVDRRSGWAVGGRAVPFTQQSESIVLSTKDGGNTWQRLSSDMLPWLKDVRFYDHQHGIACGLSSTMYPSGVVSTKDGGLTWTGMKGRVSAACQDFALGSNRTGFGTTSAGQIVSITRTSTHVLPFSTTTEAFARPVAPACVAIASPNAAIIAGSGGMLRASRDNGQSWERAAHSAGPIEFRTLASQQDNLWAAGSPGNAIIRSTDGGATWRSFRTNSTLPINALHFSDKNLGWAVGGMGTILQTTDGGKSWQQQSLSSQPPTPYRAAFMVVTNSLESLPWEAFAELCASDGYRAVVVTLDTNPKGQIPSEWLQHAAAVSVGANAAISLPKDYHSGDLAREIRIWKPDAIVVHDATVQNSGLLQTVENASKLAARSDIPLNMSEHNVNRIARIQVSDSTAPMDHVVIELAVTTSELATGARSLLCERYTTPTDKYQFILEGGEKPMDISKPKILMSATSQTRGQAARRLRDRINPTYGGQQNTVVTRRNIRAIAASGGRQAREKSAQLLHQLPEQDRADLMFEFACQAEREGDYATAVMMLERVAFDSPNHRYADAATQMLLMFKASMEVTIARQKKTKNVATTVSAEAEADLSKELDPSEPIQESRQASYVVDRVGSDTFQTQLADLVRIQKLRPKLFFSPTIRFPVAAFQRRSGRVDDAARFYRSQLNGQTEFAWRSAASTELGIIDKRSPILKPLADCTTTSSRPFLDGETNESLWANAKSIALTDSQQHASTSVRFACDHEFLYIAIECAKSSHTQCPTTDSRPRVRDASMKNVDHVRLRFDCDRDYATHWDFCIDSQGNGRDGLNLNMSWNPVWYIANTHTDETWRAEIAIHLDELVDEPQTTGNAWGLHISRHIPGETPVHWPPSKSEQVSPQDFGILQFSR